MTDTMTDMELNWADKLTPGSLMIGDFIKYDDEFVEVISLTSDAIGDNYLIEYKDPFGDRGEFTIAYDNYIDLYAYTESAE